jgi:hypothetical protein
VSIEYFRPKRAIVEMMLWDGTDERAAELIAWCGINGSGTACFQRHWFKGSSRASAAVWNFHELCWIPFPVGFRVMRGPFGEYEPLSPEAVAQGFEAVDGGAS